MVESLCEGERTQRRLEDRLLFVSKKFEKKKKSRDIARSPRFRPLPCFDRDVAVKQI